MGSKSAYNLTMLNTIIERDKCVIHTSYYVDTNYSTIIEFICACGNEHKKEFIRLFKNLAICNECSKKKAVVKFKNTRLEKYGVEQLEKIQKKRKHTNLQRYGVEHATQLEEVKEKMKQTNLLKYGEECSLHTQESKEKTKQTALKKYGVEHSSQNMEVREKCKQTVLKRYGVEYITQSAELFDKVVSYKSKDYVLPDKSIIKVQGYEPIALNILFKLGYNQNDIITSRINVPEIWYFKEEKKHRYFCDIYIKSINKIIEVKSDWTYNLNKEINMLKSEACIKKGYNFEFWIVDKDGSYKIL